MFFFSAARPHPRSLLGAIVQSFFCCRETALGASRVTKKKDVASAPMNGHVGLVSVHHNKKVAHGMYFFVIFVLVGPVSYLTVCGPGNKGAAAHFVHVVLYPGHEEGW